MGESGRINTVLGIQGLIKALASLREDVIRATADGHIDREEAVGLFGELAVALIHEGLMVASTIAQNQASKN